MHISPDRFNLTRADKAGIQAFKRHVWHNSEVCSNCFSRVRSVGDVLSKEMGVHTHELCEHYERTETGSQEHTPFEAPSDRYGVCFCETCGADLRPNHHHLAWSQMREHAKRLADYVESHTSLTLNHERFARQLAHQRFDRSETAGKESQIFAVAFARALTTQVTTQGRTQEHATAD